MAQTNQVVTSWSQEKVLATYLALNGHTLASGHMAYALEQSEIFLVMHDIRVSLQGRRADVQA
jgi:hypothetical protein